MGTTPHPDTARDPFEQTHQKVGELIVWFDTDAHTLEHEAFETQLHGRVIELARLGYQEPLDQRFERERRAPREHPRPALPTRPRTRSLETIFGRVTVRRMALQSATASTCEAARRALPRRSRLRGTEHAATMPADARLALPTQLHSAPLREIAVRHVAGHSIDKACEQIDRSTAGHLPHRQLLGLVQCVAQDVEAFYAQRTAGPGGAAEGDLQVMSVDAKGVRMRPEGLREPTRKRAEAQNKRVRASLEQDQKTRIAEMFAEAQVRDPTHARPWVVLVDGCASQLAQVRAKAEELGVLVTVIVDVIHVLHYLWTLGGLLSAANDGARDLWVREHLMRLMTRSADLVISGLRQSATLRGLQGEERKSFDAAVGCLEGTRSCLDYGAYLRLGMPIATGVIEGACRYLVQDRMNLTGARWGLQGGEAVLKVRSVDLSGDWDEFWRFHLQREHERNYVTKVAA